MMYDSVTLVSATVYRKVERVNPKGSRYENIFFLFFHFLLYLYEMIDINLLY